MKKSEMLRTAATSVMKDEDLDYSESLDIIEVLLEKANLEAFCEEQAAKKALAEEVAE